MERDRLDKLLDFEELHVLVMGDIMLDEYLLGQTTRISPEAPVPVVNLGKKVQRLGGAGNVALNTASLGANTTLIGLIGDDEAGMAVRELAEQSEGLSSMLVKDHSRKTTCKTRILAANQNLLRVDSEDAFDVAGEIVDKVEKMLTFTHLQNPISIIILQDYNKGFWSPKMIEVVLKWAQINHVKTALDPKERNIDLFKGVDIFKPNLKEISRYLDERVEVSEKGLLSTANKTFTQLNCHLLVLTLSSDGIYLKNRSKQHWNPASMQSIVDVSGAGDTVISVVALLYACGLATLEEIGALANYAGAAVCSVPGVAVVDKKMISDVINRTR